MSNNKMPLATIISLIVKNTELEEQDIMQLSLKEIEELQEMTSAKLRTAFELEQKVKKFYKENKK
jgi:hypothetical protein